MVVPSVLEGAITGKLSVIGSGDLCVKKSTSFRNLDGDILHKGGKNIAAEAMILPVLDNVLLTTILDDCAVGAVIIGKLFAHRAMEEQDISVAPREAEARGLDILLK